MVLVGKVFAERQPVRCSKRSNTAKSEDDPLASVGDFTEFGTFPRETMNRIGLRHVYTMPVALEDKSTVQISIFRAEVLRGEK